MIHFQTKMSDFQFTQFVRAENCYQVLETTVESQLKEVLTYFKIIVTQRDIFSRCLECNEREFIFVPTKDMIDIMQK